MFQYTVPALQLTIFADAPEVEEILSGVIRDIHARLKSGATVDASREGFQRAFEGANSDGTRFIRVREARRAPGDAHPRMFLEVIGREGIPEAMAMIRFRPGGKLTR